MIVIAGIVALLGLGRYLRRRKSTSSSAQPTDENSSSARPTDPDRRLLPKAIRQKAVGWRHVLLRCHEHPDHRLAVVPRAAVNRGLNACPVEGQCPYRRISVPPAVTCVCIPVLPDRPA